MMPLWLQLILASIVGNAVYDFCDGIIREAVHQWREHRRETAAMDICTAELKARWHALCVDPDGTATTEQHRVRIVADNTQGVFRPDQPSPQPINPHGVGRDPDTDWLRPQGGPSTD